MSKVINILPGKYRVKMNIYKGWETEAFNGDILTVALWGENKFNAFPTLMKDGLAVCDLDSKYGQKYCVKIE